MPHCFLQGEYVHSVSKALKGKETSETVQTWWPDSDFLCMPYNHTMNAEILNSCSSVPNPKRRTVVVAKSQTSSYCLEGLATHNYRSGFVALLASQPSIPVQEQAGLLHSPQRSAGEAV